MSILSGKTISFIGGGNMTSAIVDGLLKLKEDIGVDFEICVSDRNPPKCDAFTAKGVTAVSPEQAHEIISRADVVVLSVKPQVMAEVCQDVVPHLSDQLVLSVAAGLSVRTLSDILGGYRRIVRSMPNLPLAIGLGATGLYAAGVSAEDRKLADAIMRVSGITTWVDDEELMHAVTAVAGSAPAYFFYMLEHMIAQAFKMGLDTHDAKALAIQTIIGAGELAKTGDPSTLREQITSKGGTTAAALAVFNEQNMGQTIQDGMAACVNRSRELGEMLSKSN